MNKDGTDFTVLRHFGPVASGRTPYGGLVEGADGAIYGTTVGGGASGLGTVFRMSKAGTTFTVLHSFSANAADGQNPYAGVIEGSDGWLYGTTTQGGSDNRGTVFKLRKDGSSYLVLHSFSATGMDGDEPWGALVEGTGGALYGTTRAGGGKAV